MVMVSGVTCSHAYTYIVLNTHWIGAEKMPLLRATAVAFLQCDMALFLIIFGLHGAVAVVTMSQVHVQSGATVTIPCHYTPQYRDHVKYWCWGYIWYTCSTLAQSGSLTAGGDRVAITDDPNGGVFTVTLRDLQVGDSASYWCGVEGGSAAYLYLEVTEDLPGLRVEDSTVSGEEEASLSVRCLYGDSTRGGVRKWCRSGDWQSCLAGNSSRASDRSTVLTIDNGTGTLTVMMRRLERKDTGWYWCAAGDLQIPVHITVTQRMTTATTMSQLLLNLLWLCYERPGSLLFSSYAPPWQSGRFGRIAELGLLQNREHEADITFEINTGRLTLLTW
ncbi:hypothetical protein JZ751_015870 [Albula glossodonta]|uniref:Ig-like domain-containing protein n=1 Tax=Albula glossodonta TaxID=121402 RepID=A0A8T2MVV1_9TELE|nr:hypothetical protein JZ751_015870 [Albula glossodonta]